MGLPSIRPSDPFAMYGHKATTTAQPRLVGIIKTRAEAKARYTEIVAALQQPVTKPALQSLLHDLRREMIQFQTELPFLWSGDGDFAGLQREIEAAHVRLDPGLDYPRFDPASQETKEGTEK